MSKIFTLDDFNFYLPDELIAQHPQLKRDESKLFVLDRKKKEYFHSHFNKISNYLHHDDLLVFNNAKVIHARLYFYRESGGRIEVILARRLSEKTWLVVTNRTKKLNRNEIIYSVKDKCITMKIIDRVDDFLQVETSEDFNQKLLSDIGEMPLPPYIKRKTNANDDSRYQTVYASESGAAAAPTAGLHFTESLMSDLERSGIEFQFVTLDVSWGTFQPVRVKTLSDHKMHTEKYFLAQDAAESINQARKQGRRIVAVGTTSLRVIETTFVDGKNVPGTGDTSIFIYPPYRIQSIDALITNFHTPESTLLMLVASYAGYDEIMKAYQEAVRLKYRFFSYGDAMIIT